MKGKYIKIIKTCAILYFSLLLTHSLINLIMNLVYYAEGAFGSINTPSIVVKFIGFVISPAIYAFCILLYSFIDKKQGFLNGTLLFFLCILTPLIIDVIYWAVSDSAPFYLFSGLLDFVYSTPKYYLLLVLLPKVLRSIFYKNVAETRQKSIPAIQE